MRAPPPSLSTSVRTAGVPIRGPCLDREPRADYEIHRLGGNCLIVRCDPNPPRAVGNRDVGQAGAAIERIVPDAGDREAIDRAGDGHRTAGTVVSGDGDGAVICQVIELGSHFGGQRQEQQQREQARYAGGSDRKLLF